MFTIAADWTDLILKLLIPVAVALITKSTASARTKAVTSIVFAAVVALLTANRVDTGDAVLSFSTVQAWALNTAIAVAMYLGVYKPVVDINARAFPRFGLGG